MKENLFRILISIFRVLFPKKWKENIENITKAEETQRNIYELTGEEVSICELL